MIQDESLLGYDTVERIKAVISDTNDLKDGEAFSEDDADTLKELWNMLIEPLNKFFSVVKESMKNFGLKKQNLNKHFDKDYDAFNKIM